MENQFVPYELAVKLKELGFECDYSFKEYDTEGYLQHTGLLNTHSLPHIDAPLWQQAFDWFRVNKGLSIIIPFNGSENWYWWITETKINGIDLDSIEDYSFDSYEQARHACLEKLIEILCK